MPQKTVVDKSIKDLVIRRAKELDPSLGLKAVCLGTNPDDPKIPAFYFIAPGKCNWELTDIITDIDLEAARKIKSKHPVDFYQWPCSVDEIKNFDFIGEVIYPR